MQTIHSLEPNKSQSDWFPFFHVVAGEINYLRCFRLRGILDILKAQHWAICKQFDGLGRTTRIIGFYCN